MKITLEKFNEIIALSSYGFNGADTERTYGYILADAFPNSESFWKQFIVPLTNRLDEAFIDQSALINPRFGTSNELHEIGSFHYSIFHNFIYAHLALSNKHPSYFENFYTHLGSVCDSAEEFLMKLYFVILECKSIKSEILEKLSKEEFIKIAEEWYDENYEKVYEHYLCKGKPPPMKIPKRASVLKEYFVNSHAWQDYSKFSQRIREYRNVIVHNYQIAFVHFPDGVSYVPKKEKISLYKKWNEVFLGAQNPEKFKNHFVSREVQMAQDIHELKLVLQNLWEKPIKDMTELLLIEQNKTLLAKYDLSFI
jgi:hypothetical protein